MWYFCIFTSISRKMMMRTLSHYRTLTRVLTCPRPSPRVNLQSCRMVRYLAQNEAVNVDLELFDSYKVDLLLVTYIKIEILWNPFFSSVLFSWWSLQVWVTRSIFDLSIEKVEKYRTLFGHYWVTQLKRQDWLVLMLFLPSILLLNRLQF